MIIPLLEKAIASRAPLMDSKHEAAFRLFNGFTEGFPNLIVDIYAATAVIHDYADNLGAYVVRAGEDTAIPSPHPYPGCVQALSKHAMAQQRKISAVNFYLGRNWIAK